MTAPLCVPFHRADIVPEEDASALRRVLASGWLTTGAEADAFEREFCAHVGAVAAVAMSSCTAALHVSLRLLNIGPGDIVAVPALTFTATAAVVRQVGARVLLVDIDPETGNMDVDALDASGVVPAAIIWVHYGGNPSGLLQLLRWAATRGVPVVEDAAHALGAGVGGTPVGALPPGASVAAAFSFYPTKPLTTAEGGMLTVRPGADEERARRLSLHGIDRDAYQRSRGAVYHYDVLEEGYKYNLPDLLAALGRQQLPRMAAARVRREAVARLYEQELAGWVGRGLFPWLRVDPGAVSSWHLFVLRLDSRALRWSRDEVAGVLRERYGVGTSVHYRPLHCLHYYQQLAAAGEVSFAGLRREPRPAVDDFYDGCLSLPIYGRMTDGDVGVVVNAMQRVIDEAAR